MFADSMLAAGPIADFVTVGQPIIVEVTLPGKELVFVVEISLIQPAETAIEAPPEPEAIAVEYGGTAVEYGGEPVAY